MLADELRGRTGWVVLLRLGLHFDRHARVLDHHRQLVTLDRSGFLGGLVEDPDPRLALVMIRFEFQMIFVVEEFKDGALVRTGAVVVVIVLLGLVTWLVLVLRGAASRKECQDYQSESGPSHASFLSG